jgi:hypothetical protein
LSNHPQPDTPQPDREPDPAAPPPNAPDGTSPVSGAAGPPTPQAYQPPPPSYAPGFAAIPTPAPDNPPTAQFPPVSGGPVNYAPPGYTPDYGQGYSARPGHPETGYPGTGYPGTGYPDTGHPDTGYPGTGYPAAGYPDAGYPAAGYPDAGHSAAGYPPPQGYQQGGYPPPGYPPGGYPPHGYPGRPGPPPRKSNAPLIAVILAVTLLLCGGVATAGVLMARAAAEKTKEAVKPLTEIPTLDPELPSLPTGVPGATRKITVTYEVSGEGPATILYFGKLGETPTRLDNVKLPWKFEVELETPAFLSVSAVRVDTTDGSITCRALVDGQEVKEGTSASGAFATATCNHFALN